MITMVKAEELVTIADALANPVRLKILKLLCEKEWYVYELAKVLGISRQLLYLHLRKLEKAGLVESKLRLEEGDPRAKKYYRAKKFRIVIDNETIKELEM
ncbi:ArsR/SmtB family transcription factor [Pyrococcus kukulkanii]